jgi:uncharacterized phage protein (TIGR01671 family)
MVIDFFIYADGDIHNDTGWDDRHAGCKVNERLVLMQYTGLKDKNGKEIYEGDIVKAIGKLDKNIGIVEYRDEMASFYFKFETHAKFPMHFTLAIWNDEGFEPEVIGNIYENPELLKEA